MYQHLHCNFSTRKHQIVSKKYSKQLLRWHFSRKSILILYFIISHFKPNIHDAIWSHTIYKLQRVHYKIAWPYIAYDMSYRIELLSIPYNATKSCATKSQCVQRALIIFDACVCQNSRHNCSIVCKRHTVKRSMEP